MPNERLQEVAVVWRQVTELRLFFLRQLALVAAFSAPIPVGFPAGKEVDDTGDDGYDGKGQRDAETRDEPRPVPFLVYKDGNDAAQVAKADLPSAADGTPMMAAEVHVEPADNDGHGRVGTHGNEEEGGVLEISVLARGNEDGEAGDGDADGKYGKEKTMLELVG